MKTSSEKGAGLKVFEDEVLSGRNAVENNSQNENAKKFGMDNKLEIVKKKSLLAHGHILSKTTETKYEVELIKKEKSCQIRVMELEAGDAEEINCRDLH